MILLVSGIPASGKSTYCRWLEQDQGFIHFDIDVQMFQGTGVGPRWNSIFHPGGSTKPFVSTLRQWLRSVVIDWGFPPAKLGVVRDLKEEGVEISWFDATGLLLSGNTLNGATAHLNASKHKSPGLKQPGRKLLRCLGPTSSLP